MIWNQIWHLPELFLWSALLLAAWEYIRHARGIGKSPRYTVSLWLIAVGLISRSLIFTFWQRAVWASSEFGRIILSQRLSENPAFRGWWRMPFDHPGGYFEYYAFSRFGLDVVLAGIAAFLFFLLLKFLEKKNPRFFYPGETRLGFLCALVSGWPGFVFFVPAVFVFVVVVSLVRLFLGYKYTTLGYPMLLAAAVTLAFGHPLEVFLGLTVLQA